MDEFLARVISNAIAKRASDARGPGAPGPAPRTPAGGPAPAVAPAPPRPSQPSAAARRAVLQQGPAPVPPRAAPAAASGIEAADPFARAALTAVEAAPPAAATLLSAFRSRDDLLAGIVLSETLAPPLALRRERDR